MMVGRKLSVDDEHSGNEPFIFRKWRSSVSSSTSMIRTVAGL